MGEMMRVIGYSFPLIFFCVLAICSATKKVAWLWLILGACIQIVALIGTTTSQSSSAEIDTLYYWVAFFLILVVAALFVALRLQKQDNSSFVTSEKICFENSKIASSIVPNVEVDEYVFCLKCGANVRDDIDFCHVCGEKITEKK